MKLIEECINCGVKIIFEKKDIKKLSNEDEKIIVDWNKKIQEKLNEKKEIGLFKKKKGFKYVRTRKTLKAFIKIPYGKITCPVCDNEQLLI